MKTHWMGRLTIGVLTMLISAVPVLARDHSALNGTWVLVPANSDFAGQPVVQTGTVTISARDGTIIVSRNFVYQGAGETFFYKDSLGTENHSTVHTGKDLKTKTRWDHDTLKVTTTESGAVTEESYSLAPDATMVVNVVRPEGKTVKLVFRHP